MEELATREEVVEAKQAYEKDRREHNHWQPHWEEISHSDRLHWIFQIRAKKKPPTPAAPACGVLVVVN